MAQLGFATESRNLALQLSDPQRQAGYAATAAMMDMMGLPRTAQSSPDWYGGVTAGDYPPGIAGDDFPALGMRTHKSGMSLEGLGDDWNAFSTKSKRPAWRPYAKRLEAYIGEENMPEGIWSGKKGRTRPKKHSRRKSWREYSEALEPYAREVQGTKAAEAASRLPPGVTPPNLAGYDQYEWEADPGYQFRLDEGIRAAEASTGARGNRLSGGTLKDLLGYGQDMGAQEYQNIYNRLATLAGYGTTGVAQGVGAAGQYGMQGSNIMGDLGYNRMSAYTAGANAQSGWYGDIADVLYNLPWEDWFGGSGSGGGNDGYTAPPGVPGYTG
jgi:hypothetical protein